MDIQLSLAEVHQTRQLLENTDYPEVSSMQDAVSTLEKHNGDLETSFQELWQEQVGDLGTPETGDKSLWEVTLKVLRDELCGDEGFRSKILDYNKNPGSASILTGAIVYLVGLTTLPINPAIATIVVLYLVKVGLNIFCEYTEPSQADEAS
ncbi:MAG: hypothetical protein AAGA75_11090 [Cyanobacteria bacterium P01_E01_bin.6]